MTFELDFHVKALEEWKNLDEAVRKRLKAKLAERLEDPHVPSSRLSGAPNRYKIKLKTPGIRLVYEVDDGRLVVCVVAIGKREKNAAYLRAKGRKYVVRSR